MFLLDDAFLQSVGLNNLPEDQKQAFLQHLYEELELRVGTRLAEGMKDDQLTEFEKFIEQGDDKGAIQWLEQNRPAYKEVVAEELEKLKKEIVAGRDKILNAEAASEPKKSDHRLAA